MLILNSGKQINVIGFTDLPLPAQDAKAKNLADFLAGEAEKILEVAKLPEGDLLIRHMAEIVAQPSDSLLHRSLPWWIFPLIILSIPLLLTLLSFVM